jgi:DNA repair exonuclease SbcCD ATPase subunit
MLLSIKGFRSIKQYECEIHPESITLLSGPSGIGKSTLMNAIYWCLYGTLKNVRKFGTKTGECKVQITFDEDQESKNAIKITRSKGPDALIWEECNLEGQPMKNFKDDEAQEKINEWFGSQDIWLASCYLRQGYRNKFLESSPSDRLDFLTQLCFTSQTQMSPETYLEKIEEKCKLISREFEKQNDFYKRDLESFQKKRKQNQKYKEQILSFEDKKQIETFLSSKDKISSLDNELSLTERTESSILSLEQTKSEWIQSFPNYQNYLLSDSDKLKLQMIIDENTIDSSPKNILHNLEQKIKQKEKDLFQLDLWKKEWETKTKDFILDPQYVLNQDEFMSRKLLFETKEKQKEEIYKCHLENEKKQSAFIIYQTQLNDLNLELESIISQSCEKNYQQLQDLVEKVRWTQQLFGQKKDLETQFNLYQDILNDPSVIARDISMDQIKSSISLESKMEVQTEFLKQISVGLNKESVQKGIHIRQKIYNVQSLWDKMTELQNLEDQMNQWDEKIISLGKRKDWIQENDLPKKLLELESIQNTLYCPKCSTTLQYKDHTLFEVNHSLCQNMDTLKKCIELSKNRIEWNKEKQKLEDLLNDKFLLFQNECEKFQVSQEELSEYPQLNVEEKQKIWTETKRLEECLDIFDHSFESSQILELSKKKWDGLQIQSRLEKIQSEINEEYLLNLDEIILQKDKVKRNLERRMDIENQIQVIQEKIRGLGDWDKDSKDKLERYQMELDFENEFLNKVQQTLDIEELQSKLSKDQEFKDELENLKKELDQKYSDLEQKKKVCFESRESLGLCANAEKIINLEEKIDILRKSLVRESSIIRKEKEELLSSIEDKKSKLILSEKAEEIANEKKTLEQQRSQVVQLSNQLSTISKLKILANELAHKRMLTLLDTINDFTNEMLTILFDEPMKIEFTVYKITKSKDKVKPSIVYKIFYKGYELDNVDQLSGGEADRVSLALTCALFRFTKFPFLLLDEFASSLDLNTKETAVKTLKTFLGIGINQSKSILCISHDTVEGIYDHTIRL